METKAKVEEKLNNLIGDGCLDCSSLGSYKKVLNLRVSDLDIHMEHREREKQTKKTTKTPLNDVILHNANATEFNKSTRTTELNKYKPNCISCMGIKRRVQSLLEEIRPIRRYETYAICDHCKSTTGPICKRCQYIRSQFESEQKQLTGQQQDIQDWLSRVKELLQTVLAEDQLCHRGSDDIAEVESLLKQLHPTAKVQRQPEMAAFPSKASVEDLAPSRDVKRQAFNKVKMGDGRRYSSNDSLYVSISKTKDRVWKSHNDRSLVRRTPKDLPTQLTTSKVSLDKATEKRQSDELLLPRTRIHRPKQKPPKKGKENQTNENSVGAITPKISNENPTKVRKSSPKTKQPLVRVHSKQQLFEKQPVLTVHSKQLLLDDNDTAITECNAEMNKAVPKEMICGLKVVPFNNDYFAKRDGTRALLFNADLELDSLECPLIPMAKSEGTVTTTSSGIKKNDSAGKQEDRSGVIVYRLSDRKFIDIGWTQLPTLKTLRKMYVYKMLPASSFDWFSQNKNKRYYESGEKLSETDESGRGFWFYKNGLVALEYDETPDSISKKRFTILSHEVDEGKRSKSHNVLACFDYCGNGIVYDSRGNERLKYNQTEGYVFDDKIAPPGRWKWHTMNEPPVLEKIFIDTHPKNPSPELEELMQQFREPNNHNNDSEEAMLDIELQNFVKEKAYKLRNKFKPFEIRMKALKINDYFSLKVVDQSNIHLLFRDGTLQLKINLGMLLQCDEIVATDMQETGVVETPYDRRPSRPSFFKSNISFF